ncbi:MAG: GH3 auxin-responsive promoter family protein [Bacteroidia bacterium]|nr:GH3 auxin-responsive promoter family protein [Bacteroidia bacterium]
MGLKSLLAKPFAALIASKVKKEAANALKDQEKWFSYLVVQGRKTRFGKESGFEKINSYSDWKNQVPVRDYEALKPWIDAAVEGESDVLWPGRPLYWAKTSGTTSGVKYIPITKESIPFHINSARNALLCYIAETGNSAFVDGKLIFLSGSPEMDKKHGVFTGRLSGIVNHHVPQYLRRNQLPSYATNCMEDWEAKVRKIVDETISENMTLISGIPPWVQMYFDLLSERSGKSVGELFPNFSVFVYGGVNFEPYRARIEQSIGRKINTIETYPASEGFIAYQDKQAADGLLLLTNNGIFYEFIPVDEYFNENPSRLQLHEVELNKNYALLLSTNAGLFGYSIGDTVKFVSLKPYRILVTGRIKHFISAFGEHVIGEEVEFALMQVAKKYGVEVIEFTVAPQVNPPEGGMPYHEWFVEFAEGTVLPSGFAEEVDHALQQKNIYYQDLISGSVLKPLVLRQMKKGSFIELMKSMGKLGGQNKVPRLSNDRKLAEALSRI